jgi:hypothetical protein
MSNHTTKSPQHVSLKTEKENPMKKITLLDALVAIVFALVGPATVLGRTLPVANPRVPKPSRRSTSSISWPPQRSAPR